MSNSYRFIRNHINTAITNISQNLTNKKFSLKNFNFISYSVLNGNSLSPYMEPRK